MSTETFAIYESYKSPLFDLNKGDRVTIGDQTYIVIQIRLENGTDNWTYDLELATAS